MTKTGETVSRWRKFARMFLWTGTVFVLLLSGVLPASCRRVPLPPEDILAQSLQDDAEITEAANRARASFPEFIRHLQNPGPGERRFFVKYPFRAAEGSGFRNEELWLEKIHFRDGVFYGKVASPPLFAENIKEGDTVEFSADGITDWFYERSGTVAGGFSIPILLRRLGREPGEGPGPSPDVYGFTDP